MNVIYNHDLVVKAEHRVIPKQKNPRETYGNPRLFCLRESVTQYSISKLTCRMALKST